MAVLTRDEIFTAGANGANIESGHGRALINGIQVNLNDLTFAGRDGVVTVGAITIETEIEHNMSVAWNNVRFEGPITYPPRGIDIVRPQPGLPRPPGIGAADILIRGAFLI